MVPKARTSGWNQSSAATDPLSLGLRIHQVLKVTLPGAEEEADFMVGVAGIRPVITVVTISLFIVASIETVLKAADGLHVVDGSAPAPSHPMGNIFL